MTNALSKDVAEELQATLEAGRSHPLPREELIDLITRVAQTVRDRSTQAGRGEAFSGTAADLAEAVVQKLESKSDTGQHAVDLKPHNGVEPTVLLPTPTFQGDKVPMRQGWVSTRDIDLWIDNDRIEIHVQQFRRVNGRRPTPRELLKVMMGRAALPGVDQDQFKVEELARSIAANGVRRPPIIDRDGTLLDGNRRIAACNHILSDDSYTTEEKERASTIFVWQLSEHATDSDRNRVVVSLNFEDEHKIAWPKYIKARKVYEQWQAMLEREPRANASRQNEIKKEISRRFALGPRPTVVTQYLKMMEAAQEFEDFHVNDRNRDESEVRHRTNDVFEYFDELTKGMRDGVAFRLGNDDLLKQAVHDILYGGGFKRYAQIRDLKHVAVNDDVREQIIQVAKEEDPDLMEEKVEDCISAARMIKKEERVLGANVRVEQFVKWLLQLPVDAFYEKISSESLEKLLQALERVKVVISDALASKTDGARGEGDDV